MKKWLQIYIAVILGVLVHAPFSHAYIYNLTQMSPEWTRTGNRNAATDALDSVFYNPAGVSSLPRGFHLNLFSAVQLQNKTCSIKEGNTKTNYSTEDDFNLFPCVFGVLGLNKWSVFGSVDIPNGETLLSYSKGSPATHLIGRTILASPLHNSGYRILTNALTEGLSQPPHNFVKVGNDGSGDKHLYSDISKSYYEEKGQYHTSTLGVSYKFNTRLSLAFGIRHVNADLITKAGLDISELSEDALVMNSVSPGFFPERISFASQRRMVAWGTGGIFGLNAFLTENMTVAMQIKTPVKLYERVVIDKDELNLFLNKEKQRNDLPGQIGIGFGWKVSESVKCEIDYSHWFISNAKREGKNGDDINEMAGDAWRSGAALSWELHPKILYSAGVNVTTYDYDDISAFAVADTGIAETLLGDNFLFATGLSLSVFRNMRVTIGVSHTVYDKTPFTMKSHNASLDVTVENASTIVALGIETALW